MVPAAVGAGSPVACAAADQLAAVIGAVEYRTSYDVAVPVTLSSPTAVQRSAAVVSVVPVIARVVMGAGRTASVAARVVRERTFDMADQLGTSSPTFMANQ